MGRKRPQTPGSRSTVPGWAILLVTGAVAATMSEAVLTGFAEDIAAGCAILLVLGIAIRHHVVHAHDATPSQEAALDTESASQPQQTSHAHEQAETTSAITTPNESEPETSDTLTVELSSEPKPASPQAPEPSAPSSTSQSSFVFGELRLRVLLSDEPMDVLAEFVRSVHDRTNKEDCAEGACDFERFLARQLEEAGLLQDDELPSLRFVWPRHSRMFYARVQSSQIAYGSYLRLLAIEAALNLGMWADQHFDDVAAASETELYRFQARLLRSICAQVPDVDTADWTYLAMPWQGSRGPADQGEWALRQALAEAIESAQVPYRLETTFRANVAAGDVALRMTFVPPRVFPRSAFVDGLGIVSTTTQMRSREASSYAARVGILLANHAFRANRHVRRVWVECVEETPTRYACRYSVCFDRRSFSHLHMESIIDPLEVLAQFGAQPADKTQGLLPVSPTFYMEDERFCPSKRHDIWRLSERSLDVGASQALGANHVSDLRIHEELPRSIAAELIMRSMDSKESRTTEESVRSVMDVARNSSDFSVLDATERLVRKLVDGSIDPADSEAMEDELLHGDQLSKSLEQAQQLLQQGKPHEALERLRNELACIDQHGWYRDTASVACRCFDSFAERCVYNRLHRQDNRSVMLVPDAYVYAHLFAAALLMGMRDMSTDAMRRAHEHATQAVAIAPLSSSARLSLVACLEQEGDLQGAADELCDMLKTTFEPQAIGLAYYRLAAIQWQLGAHDACQACYQRSALLFPPLVPIVLAECHALMASGMLVDEDMDAEKTVRVLKKHDIPIAPTERLSYMLYECAAASVDAEVFPVARELMSILEALTGDDVIRCMRQSLEREPDL